MRTDISDYNGFVMQLSVAELANYVVRLFSSHQVVGTMRLIAVYLVQAGTFRTWYGKRRSIQPMCPVKTNKAIRKPIL